jgi:hypothetical protein
VFKELLLNHVQTITGAYTLNCSNFRAFYFDTQYKTGTNKPAIEGHRTGTTIAGATAFLCARQVQVITQYVEQGIPGLAQKFLWFPVDTGCYV